MGTVSNRTDGFGAQFQTLIYGIVILENKGETYYHTPIESMAHNYENDPVFLNKIEELMNIKNNYKCITDASNVKVYNYVSLINIFEKSMNMYLSSPSLTNIKMNFWKNKERDFFKNNKLNVAVHIRRENKYDITLDPSRICPLVYYFNLINKIREKYKNNDKKLLFHIYSQNNINNYKRYDNSDLCFHLNENLSDSFIGLVAADILITSKSSFSYVAAILSDGEIYYTPFWHPPSKNWIVCN